MGFLQQKVKNVLSTQPSERYITGLKVTTKQKIPRTEITNVVHLKTQNCQLDEG